MSIDNQIDDVVNKVHGQTVMSGASVKNKLIDIIQTLEEKAVDSNAPMGAIIDELHDAIISSPPTPVPVIPVDEDSLTPLHFGVSQSGFVLSSNPAHETSVAFGVDVNGHPYVKGGTT